MYILTWILLRWGWTFDMLPSSSIDMKRRRGLHVSSKLLCIMQKSFPMLCIFCDFFIVAIMLFLISAHFERLLVMPCIQGGHNFALLTALQSLALPILEMTGPNAKAQARKLRLTRRQNLFPLDHDFKRGWLQGGASEWRGSARNTSDLNITVMGCLTQTLHRQDLHYVLFGALCTAAQACCATRRLGLPHRGREQFALCKCIPFWGGGWENRCDVWRIICVESCLEGLLSY